jgi:hypothetical protein
MTSRHLSCSYQKCVSCWNHCCSSRRWITFCAMSIFALLLTTLRDCARSRAILELELLALRHQLHVLERSPESACSPSRCRGQGQGCLNGSVTMPRSERGHAPPADSMTCGWPRQAARGHPTFHHAMRVRVEFCSIHGCAVSLAAQPSECYPRAQLT